MTSIARSVPSPLSVPQQPKISRVRPVSSKPVIINKHEQDAFVKKPDRGKLTMIKTDRLKPIKHKTPKGYVEITEEGWVIIFLAKKH